MKCGVCVDCCDMEKFLVNVGDITHVNRLSKICVLQLDRQDIHVGHFQV
jgi:hypothetical protein